jgi:hypothetical protein
VRERWHLLRASPSSLIATEIEAMLNAKRDRQCAVDHVAPWWGQMAISSGRALACFRLPLWPHHSTSVLVAAHPSTRVSCLAFRTQSKATQLRRWTVSQRCGLQKVECTGCTAAFVKSVYGRSFWHHRTSVAAYTKKWSGFLSGILGGVDF